MEREDKMASDVQPKPDIFQGMNLGELEKSLLRPRDMFNVFCTVLTAGLTFAAIVPLFSVLYKLIVRGGGQLSMALFTELPPTVFDTGGGIGNAILGTLVIVGIATAISVPIGLMAAIYLAEIGPDTRLAKGVRFSAKILTGFPSVLAGVFVYGSVVLLTKEVLGTGGFSAVAGAIALALLMIPTIILTAEDAITMVPAKMREAAIGMGTTPAQTVWKVLLPSAVPGILTGVMLAVARAGGETAPLLFTALFSNDWLSSGGSVDLMQPTASLAVLIYNFSGSPSENQVEIAWAAALVLVLLVLVTNVIGQALSPRRN
jgi:phosphate transport system permease protein